MFGSALFLALFDTALSISGDLPRTCTDDPPCPIDQPNRIPWRECGGYLPMCDIARCCTDKYIKVASWNPQTIPQVTANDGNLHIDARSVAKTSLLMYAARKPNVQLVTELITEGASVNLQNEFGRTALMQAAWRGYTDIVKKLLEANALTDITDRDGKNAVMYASTREATGLLLDYCAEVSVEAVNVALDDLKETLTRAQNNPLIAAVLRGSENGASYIVQNPDACMNGKSFNATFDGKTAMEHARALNKDGIENILLEQYAKFGKDLLDAARVGDLETGRKLLTQGVNVAADNNAAIVAAVENNHLDFVDFLLGNNAPADARNSNNKPVLLVAAGKNNTDIVSSLVLWGASNSLTNCSDNAQSTACEVETQRCDSALTVAMRKGYMVVVEHLTGRTREGIDQVFCADGTSYSSLTWASKYGHAGIVSSLLRKCADISFQTDEKTSLEIAQDNKNTDIIAKLEAAKWPYITAIKADGVQSLLPFEGDVCNRSHVNETKEGRSPLMLAVDLVKEKIVDELIELNADVNAKNDGQTALMLAAIKNNAIVESLLQSPEIEVSAQDKDGRSALMIAAEGCIAENVRSLADKRINVDVIDAKKQTALMHAVRCPADVVQTLLDNGANVGARGDQGRTALMQAVDYCNAPVVSVLLEKGNANVSMRYEDNETVVMRAVKKCETDVVNHLKNHSSEEQIDIQWHCVWSVWGTWSNTCVGDCGLSTAKKFRYRYVEKPQLHGEAECTGGSAESEDCKFPACNSTMYCEGSLLSGNLTEEVFTERRSQCREQCMTKCTPDDLCGDAAIQRGEVWVDPNWTRRWFGTTLGKFMAEIALGDSFEYLSVSAEMVYKPCMWLLPTCANASDCNLGTPFNKTTVAHTMDNFYQWYFSNGELSARASPEKDPRTFRVGGNAMKSEDGESHVRDRCEQRCKSWCFESCTCNWGWDFPWSNDAGMGWTHGKPMRYRWIRGARKKQSYGTWACVSSDGVPLRAPWDKPFWSLDVYSDSVKEYVNIAPLQFNLVCEHIKHYYALQVCGTEKCKLNCTRAARPVVDFLYDRKMLQPMYMEKDGEEQRADLVNQLREGIRKNCRRTCAEAHVPEFLQQYPIR